MKTCRVSAQRLCTCLILSKFRRSIALGLWRRWCTVYTLEINDLDHGDGLYTPTYRRINSWHWTSSNLLFWQRTWFLRLFQDEATQKMIPSDQSLDVYLDKNILHDYNFKQYQIGPFWLCVLGNQAFTYRIIGTQQQCYLTRARALDVADITDLSRARLTIQYSILLGKSAMELIVQALSNSVGTLCKSRILFDVRVRWGRYSLVLCKP